MVMGGGFYCKKRWRGEWVGGMGSRRVNELLRCAIRDKGREAQGNVFLLYKRETSVLCF